MRCESGRDREKPGARYLYRAIDEWETLGLRIRQIGRVLMHHTGNDSTWCFFHGKFHAAYE